MYCVITTVTSGISVWLGSWKIGGFLFQQRTLDYCSPYEVRLVFQRAGRGLLTASGPFEFTENCSSSDGTVFSLRHVRVYAGAAASTYDKKAAEVHPFRLYRPGSANPPTEKARPALSGRGNSRDHWVLPQQWDIDEGDGRFRSAVWVLRCRFVPSEAGGCATRYSALETK